MQASTRAEQFALAEALNTWRPPPRIGVDEWADCYRHLSPEASAEPGPWRNANAPHLVEPMRRLSRYSSTERVVCKFASQTGKTELINNLIGYVIDCDPGPILTIQPNVTPMAERFSKQRIAPMLRDTPTLAAKMQFQHRNSANTILEKQFPGGQLFIGGANSPAGLASMPIRYLLCDEVDRWEVTREGDPMTLARKRQQTYRKKRISKQLVVSSPTYDDLGISIEYAKCDIQHQWHLACLHCGAHQFPRLKHFQVTDGDLSTLRYVCEHCGAEHPLADEDRVKATGQWVVTADSGQSSAGYWMNQWASPFARWDDTLREWLDAGTDPAQRQVVTNTVFAEGWEGDGERVDAHALEQRCEDYAAPAPANVAAITIGVDVQHDRLEAEIVGWGMIDGHMESWSLGYEILIGEPTDPEVWADLKDLYQTPWEHESGAMLKPIAMCVDSGNWSKVIYEWVKAQRDRSIIPIKGASSFGADALTGNDRDRRKRSAKRLIHGRPAEIIGVGQIKLIIQRQLAAPAGKHGYCHFPTGRGREYFDQLTGERLMIDQKRGKRPTRTWVKVHAAVEALDCRVYAYAALLLSGVDLTALSAARMKPGAPPPASGPRIKRKAASWL